MWMEEAFEGRPELCRDELVRMVNICFREMTRNQAERRSTIYGEESEMSQKANFEEEEQVLNLSGFLPHGLLGTSLSMDHMATLFDRDRKRWWMERFFSPPELREVFECAREADTEEVVGEACKVEPGVVADRETKLELERLGRSLEELWALLRSREHSVPLTPSSAGVRAHAASPAASDASLPVDAASSRALAELSAQLDELRNTVTLSFAALREEIQAQALDVSTQLAALAAPATRDEAPMAKRLDARIELVERNQADINERMGQLFASMQVRTDTAPLSVQGERSEEPARSRVESASPALNMESFSSRCGLSAFLASTSKNPVLPSSVLTAADASPDSNVNGRDAAAKATRLEHKLVLSHGL
eukprot:NODE_663_length_1420_cov_266.192674.p1 GENE.NODE_663_length_1420_cov_266.192674~~NODE_663_length_1420_cov_266.192674.p1  ORF type:complete len:365 (-),score=93.51 NODE_663_length_1420_cov_266.192674:280-1374(-)